MSGKTLKGMTWDHPRGYEPLDACAASWQQRTGVNIVWDKRSLQDFESFPVDELAKNYDLIVIDHPHVGEITANECLLPLDSGAYASQKRELSQYSVGQSFDSYCWQGRQWALPIDAAAQVQAYRPDLIEAPLAQWGDVLALARDGAVALPLRPPHNLMALYTLVANMGGAHGSESALIDQQIGAYAFRELERLANAVDPACFNKDPIAVCEDMGRQDSAIACAPLIYGYISYSRTGFRAHPLAFADIPGVAENGPEGSALGGTGIAVSAYTSNPNMAVDFAYWVASAEAQKGVYAEAGGQPAHDLAWRDPIVNANAVGFYINTRSTLDGAWVRPRHNGAMAFQQEASDRVNKALQNNEHADQVIEEINNSYVSSL